MEIPSIFLNRILVETTKKGANTLHLTVGSAPIIRVNDQLSPMAGESMITTEILDKLIDTFLTEEEKKILAVERGLVTVKTLAGNFRYRINIYYQKDLPVISFRNIPANIKSAKDLGLPKFIQNLAAMNSGLFLVAGPQLSGKSSTSAAILEEVNQNHSRHIITIEDPIEALFVSKKSVVEQRQVGRDVRTLEAGVRYCLEEDADVVFVGDVKGKLGSVIQNIISLASGSSLVILELNARSAVSAVEKVIDALQENMPTESARYNLADVLVGAMAQKLLPRVGGGLVLVEDILLVNEAAKPLIREGKIYQLESIMQISRKEGMTTMEKRIEELLTNGEVRREELDKKLI